MYAKVYTVHIKQFTERQIHTPITLYREGEVEMSFEKFFKAVYRVS